MNLLDAQNFLINFVFNDAVHPAHLAPINVATANYVLRNQAVMANAINNRFTRMRELLQFLDKGYPMYQRGDILMAVNHIFNLRLARIDDVSRLLTSPHLTNKCLQLRRLPIADLQRIQAFFVAAQLVHPLAEIERATRIIELFPGNGASDVLDVLDEMTAQLPGAPIAPTARVLATTRLGRLLPTSMPDLIRIVKKYPGWLFTGFTRWGPGNHATPQENYEEHFKKHVCNSSLAFPEEAVFWWGALNISLTIADLQNPAPDPVEAALFDVDGTLGRRGRETFLRAHLHSRMPLMNTLLAKYGPVYSEYAMRASREMGNVAIESDGSMVLISSFSGHVIVFGRFDSDVSNETGLSTCYFVLQPQRPVKLNRDKPTKIMSMHT
ncbi:hypothetical protein FVF58_48010 [Paraburkholderia panacisoli]|uniref:Uncharacterized protein n=1 Tax=Paraburkholderia panacisoli TaxID=2603818 RepID=A0A5B0G2P3_9BURK|nr:hypothetical protein [Paraburkholderia panacisoli]KAA0997676.1 hypothetical protein FVF58_48010 [Paraburkholderia panacisoli]